MSTFYGTLQGSRGPATRCGTRNSGIKVAAQSYDGSVITSLRYNENERLMVRIELNKSSVCYGGWDMPDWYGTFDELCELLSKKE